MGKIPKKTKKAHPPKREMSLAKLWCFEKNDVSDLLSQLILTDLQIANLDVGAIIAIDTPTVLLNAIDAVGIAANIIDVHHTDTVVGVGCSSREFSFSQCK